MVDERWPAVIILARVIHQNKRCLLAYHSQRLGLIRTAYWAAGGAVAHVLRELQDSMSPEEIDYLRSYHESVTQYRDQLSRTDVLDLALGVDDPPTESAFITVETVIRPGGPIWTELGLMEFEFGARYIVLKRDVEHLILQGYLRQVY
ncbi:hypothetical protein B0H12DRAFT_1101628 [Mycena haematopus]|nr:hypothetical protein B0H12DRAFT_1101628 [Mycena haematopus]